jgi:GNAT superfamily N-acetyltransferase
MIRALSLDEAVFKKKIGQIDVVITDVSQARQLSEEGEKRGFTYLLYRTPTFQVPVTRMLGAAGFYLSDVAVSWQRELADSSGAALEQGSTVEALIQRVDDTNIRTLQRLVKGGFLDSRFYNDPFYSVDGADQLFQLWIENSVKDTSGAVFWVPNKGFASVKTIDAQQGSIVLMGVGEQYRRQGIGKALMRKSLAWFQEAGVHTVTVRTQLKNINAMNFYGACGFSIAGYDMVFAQVLTPG